MSEAAAAAAGRRHTFFFFLPPRKSKKLTSNSATKKWRRRERKICRECEISSLRRKEEEELPFFMFSPLASNRHSFPIRFFCFFSTTCQNNYFYFPISLVNVCIAVFLCAYVNEKINSNLFHDLLQCKYKIVKSSLLLSCHHRILCMLFYIT